MQYIDFNNPVNVHFTGIGGISMSGLAELLLTKGFRVTGSDRKETVITKHLEELGAAVKYGTQCADNVPSDTAVLVYSAAIKEDNPERVEARRLGIPEIDRGHLVGDTMLHYANNYSVAGTHGKTTSTSMLSLVLIAAGYNPTVQVGGVLPEIGSNIRIGGSEHFVIESCEYCDSFLNFHPTKAIITNLEPEHLDYFKTFERECESFRRFAGLLPSDGLLVVSTSVPRRDELFADVTCPIITYSVSDPEAEYRACDITYNEFGFPSFTVIHNGSALGSISLNVPGEHNVANAVGVTAMAVNSGISFETTAAALTGYHGTERRFEKKGVVGGITIIDDYAHHPTEMRATLTAAQRYPHKTLWTVFQPHTYSRTAAFKDEIAEALSLSDKVILADIYAAREVNTYGISSRDIAEILSSKYGKEVYYFSGFDEIGNFLLQHCCTGDLLITMGAGDVVTIGESLLGK